jgi:tetratricopeptide (TPR) repeat protein
MSNRTDGMTVDAIRSVVDWCDGIVLASTHGYEYDGAAEREAAGDKLHIVHLDPIRRAHDTAPRRQDCLIAAHRLGYDWALLLDSDERITDAKPAEIRRILESCDEQTWLIGDALGRYPKDKFFRLPAVGQWTGEVHECYAAPGKRGLLSCLRFTELTRNEEQAVARLESIRRDLTEILASNPERPRDWYYLADAIESLAEPRRLCAVDSGDTEAQSAAIADLNEALIAFQRAGESSPWDQEAAWSYFRAALILARLGMIREAYDLAVRSAGKCPGFGDVMWLLGSLSLDLGRPVHAAQWARMAIAAGSYTCGDRHSDRVIFKHPPGMWELPYFVLADACRALGDLNAEAQWRAEGERAQCARLAQQFQPVMRKS